MTFKTALLISAAGALFAAAPAVAQETMTPAQEPAAAAAPQQQSLQLTPGAAVRGPDGELGKLEGVQSNAQGDQELTVRGADGQLRAVPLGGIRQDGADVVVAYTKAEYDAASPIAGAAPAPAADPAAGTMPGTTPTTTEPADPSATPDPMAPPAEPDQPQR